MGEIPARIVLIEDNPGDVYLVRLALREAGLSADLLVLQDGAQAMALAGREAPYADVPVPDLILLDLNLPKRGGLEVLAALRSHSVYASVPVVVFSSSCSPAEQARVQELGAARFLAKPPDLDQFLAMGAVLKAMLEREPSGR